jgi:coproporphyrinogen III oxidase-like Fe-S oxidoreductase
MLFAEFFENAPGAVDVRTVESYGEAARGVYDPSVWVLPLPVWRLRPYDDFGVEAWDILRADLAAAAASRPMCVYLHIPFCSRKCGFCDSYSFALGSHRQERIDSYVERLCQELVLWSEQGNLSQRPVSTVHLGGGTPTFLGEAALTRIVETCRQHFATTAATEWALESTSQELTPSMMTTMHDLGFRRLHVGVQTLQDEARQAIGRKTSAREVLTKIEAALRLDWVVSVDLICGLPHQSLHGFIGDLETLLAVGVNGFSLYELLIYPQNQRWALRHGLDHTERHQPNYWMFLTAADLLERRGYRKNLFNHWADERDHNVYFTFPSREEDLLAVGAIADGVFGDYHYRHPRYAPYLESGRSGLPGLEGGLRRPPSASRIQPLVTGILAAHIPPDQVTFLASQHGGASLIERWLRCRLMEPDREGGLRLTSSGSWFAGNLVQEVSQLGRADH